MFCTLWLNEGTNPTMGLPIKICSTLASSYKRKKNPCLSQRWRLTFLGQGLFKIKILNHIIKLNPIVTKTVTLKFHPETQLTFDFQTFWIGDVSLSACPELPQPQQGPTAQHCSLSRLQSPMSPKGLCLKGVFRTHNKIRRPMKCTDGRDFLLKLSQGKPATFSPIPPI